MTDTPPQPVTPDLPHFYDSKEGADDALLEFARRRMALDEEERPLLLGALAAGVSAARINRITGRSRNTLHEWKRAAPKAGPIEEGAKQRLLRGVENPPLLGWFRTLQARRVDASPPKRVPFTDPDQVRAYVDAYVRQRTLTYTAELVVVKRRLVVKYELDRDPRPGVVWDPPPSFTAVQGRLGLDWDREDGLSEQDQELHGAALKAHQAAEDAYFEPYPRLRPTVDHLQTDVWLQRRAAEYRRDEGPLRDYSDFDEDFPGEPEPENRDAAGAGYADGHADTRARLAEDLERLRLGELPDDAPVDVIAADVDRIKQGLTPRDDVTSPGYFRLAPESTDVEDEEPW
ncbi:hypothetical protein [Embleya scabrispora]|nr:hypothetical protein [Embleya scabrispora]